MADKELQTLDQKTVDFYGDELAAARLDDGRIYASLRHMCQALDIDTTGQRQRINRHKVLNSGLGVCKLQTPGGLQDSYVLRVDLVPLWLTGIRTSAVNETVRPKLEKFQEEAAAVLWEAFQEGRLTADSSFDDLLASDSLAAQAYRMAQAVMTLARQQLLIESRVVNVEGRLELIEAQMGRPDRFVTEDQASQISQAVKAVAMVLSKASGTNQYGSVYGELYRKFGITSYKQLPAARFEEAMAFLTEWHQGLVGEEQF